jgi:hypothetical protein
MGRRLALVFVVAVALGVFAGGAASSGGAKFKLKLTSLALTCNTSCGMHPFESLVIKRLDDDHHSCQPDLPGGFDACKWTAQAGTKVVLQTTDNVEPVSEIWGGDASCVGTKCTIVVDSNKGVTLSIAFP